MIEIFKKGYYLSASLFVLSCLVFFGQQLIYDLSFFHPDTRAVAVFELCSILYNLVFVVIQSLIVGRLLGCPYDRKSISFVAIFAISAFLFTVWFGSFIASMISNSRSFLRIGIFCLICTAQTVLLPAVIYFGEQPEPKPVVDLEAAHLNKKKLAKVESSKT